MKCVSCGAEISFTDSKCPYCGRDLTETAGYRADIDDYEKQSGEIEGKAGNIISENIPMVISAVVMLLLIIAIIIAAYVEDNAYIFKENLLRRESVKKYDEYSEKLQAYLDAGDYTGFYSFMDYHNIPEYKEPYNDLALIKDMADSYTAMVSNVESAIMYGPDASIYHPEDEIHTCSRSISDFYWEFEYKLSDIDEDPYKEYIYDMRDKADLMLEIYFGLDKDGRAKYFEGSENAQEAYLEGGDPW